MRHTLLLIAAALLISVTSASAQSSDPYYTTFSADYDVVYHETGATSNAGAHFDVASTIKRDVPFLAVAGEVGFNHFDGGTVASFLGGARLRFPNAAPRVLPFAQVLGGLYHCGVCNIDDFALQFGGGVDVRLARTNDVRVRGQIDVRHVFDTFDSFNAVRLSAGVVIPLNR